MVQRSDRALILRRFAFGESSLVLQVLTRELGRVHLIAKGAYRPTSRYYAALDLFDTLDLDWSEQRGREPLDRITSRRCTLLESGAGALPHLLGDGGPLRSTARLRHDRHSPEAIRSNDWK